MCSLNDVQYTVIPASFAPSPSMLLPTYDKGWVYFGSNYIFCNTRGFKMMKDGNVKFYMLYGTSKTVYLL